jgi:hypothetical protein
MLALIVLCPALLTRAESSLVKQAGTDVMDPAADPTRGTLKWGHGGFVHADGAPTPTPTFRTLDREGNLTRSAAVSIPGAEKVDFNDFDRSADGSVAFAGVAWSSSGQRSPFIAWLSSDGSTERVISTGRYTAFHLSIAPDGTVWALGYDAFSTPGPQVSPNPGADVLKHFDRGGKLLGSALPQSGFTSGSERARIVSGRLVAQRDRLGWYSAIGGNSRYVEISTDSMTQRTLPGLPPKYCDKWWDGAIDGLAMTEGGDVIVSIDDHRANDRRVYKFDRATSEWAPLNVPGLGGYSFTPHLVGSDGDRLVFRYDYSAAFFSLSH